MLAEPADARGQLLPAGGSQRGAGGRGRARGRDRGRGHAATRHHRPARHRGRRQPDRRGLQDGTGALGALRRGSMGGVQTYALLCESLLGRAPAEVRLLYLRQPVAISSAASEQTIRGQRRRPSPSGPPLSGRATPRTSAPRRPVLRPLPLRTLPAPPSPRERTAVSPFDEAVDAAFEPLRGPPGDRPGRRVVSNLADYGFVWVLLAGLKARRPRRARRRAVVALGAAGFSSLIVSRVVKAAVERQRPDDHLDAAVRDPLEQQLPEWPHPGGLLHRLRARRLRRRHRGQRRFRRCRGRQPGAPARPPPRLTSSAVRSSGRCSGWDSARWSTSSRPAEWGGGGRRRHGGRGMGPAEVVLKEL